jgi:small-conductance mechanosensitive channel
MNESPAFQGISVFIGVFFSLGSTSVISNMVSGLVITYMRPFKVGDRIKMGEFLGNVVEKKPLVTRIKTPKNELITIPNANIMTAQTINYSYSAQEYGLILYETVTMGYETPWRKIHEALLEAATNTPHVLTTPKPFVLQTALDDFYVEYQINIYTKEADLMPSIYSELNKNIQDVFAREKLELLSPHYRAQYKERNEVKQN